MDKLKKMNISIRNKNLSTEPTHSYDLQIRLNQNPVKSIQKSIEIRLENYKLDFV